MLLLLSLLLLVLIVERFTKGETVLLGVIRAKYLFARNTQGIPRLVKIVHRTSCENGTKTIKATEKNTFPNNILIRSYDYFD